MWWLVWDVVVGVGRGGWCGTWQLTGSTPDFNPVVPGSNPALYLSTGWVATWDGATPSTAF
jgi:hypothetical protein